MRKLKYIFTLLLFTSETWCQQGIRRLKREPIIEGSVKKISEVPYFASIVQYDRDFQRWFPVCGASIISNNFILTAAHCIIGPINGLKIRIGFGDYFSSKYADSLHDIFNVIPHPNYVYQDIVNYNDIGLINLTNPIDFVKNLQMPISLASKAFDVRTGLRLTILGLGFQKTQFDGKKEILPAKLLSGTVKVMKRKDCEKLYASYNIENHFCATSRKNEVALGDSGGPAVAKSRLIGIISTGGMKRDKYPGLYIDVRKFVDWIANIVGHEHLHAVRQKDGRMCFP